MTVRDAILGASATIDRRDAEVLLQHVFRCDRAKLLAYPDAELRPEQSGAFEALTVRRAAHEPLQYLTGHQEFFSLHIGVMPGVLIPRPETEILVEAVLDWARAGADAAPKRRVLHIVDIGTGSGAIALALATHLPTARITALDLSPSALCVARENVQRLDLADRIRLLPSDLLGAVEPEVGKGLRFDVIVSNPPYVPEADAAGMQPEVRDFEPHGALFAGPDGLAIYRRIIPAAFAALRPGGLLALEIGFGQREAVGALLRGWCAVRFVDDLAQIPRVALAERPEESA